MEGGGPTLARVFMNNPALAHSFSLSPHRQEAHFGVYLTERSELFQTMSAMPASSRFKNEPTSFPFSKYLLHLSFLHFNTLSK